MSRGSVARGAAAKSEAGAATSRLVAIITRYEDRFWIESRVTGGPFLECSEGVRAAG
jgi:hypothetical protein